ncbi:Hint domain-containing protein [Microbaculum marinum]
MTFVGVATADGHEIAFFEDSAGILIGFSDTDIPSLTYYTLDTDATYAVCFAAGTLIRTPDGDLPVETLAEGDTVVTASGEERAIRWSGARTVDCSTTTNPRQAWPVRVSEDAFGPGLPERELWLSPAHAVQVSAGEQADAADDVLVPIGSLVNGATIEQIPLETIDYYHIELDTHDVVIANGLPAESYLDCGNRDFFAGADVAPESERAEIDPADLPFCLPLVTGGGVVEEVRAQLGTQAREIGWASKAAEPEVAVEAGGTPLLPDEIGGKLRVTLPADACDAWLVSSSWVPYHHGAGADRRNLGVVFRHLTVTDATGEARRIRADDPRLAFGFHEAEGEDGAAFRWTTGRALLPGALWGGMSGQVTLTFEVHANERRRWIAPAKAAAAPARRMSLVA